MFKSLFLSDRASSSFWSFSFVKSNVLLGSSIVCFCYSSSIGSLLIWGYYYYFFYPSSILTFKSLILASLDSLAPTSPVALAFELFLIWTTTSSSSSLSIVRLRCDIFASLSNGLSSRASPLYAAESLRLLKLPLRENLRILKLC